MKVLCRFNRVEERFQTWLLFVLYSFLFVVSLLCLPQPPPLNENKKKKKKNHAHIMKNKRNIFFSPSFSVSVSLSLWQPPVTTLFPKYCLRLVSLVGQSVIYLSFNKSNSWFVFNSFFLNYLLFQFDYYYYHHHHHLFTYLFALILFPILQGNALLSRAKVNMTDLLARQHDSQKHSQILAQ